jgi:hypothetical protein
MPIPQTQLITWSHQGAVTTSSAAYNSIRTALLAASSPLNEKGVEIFLQGSYANTTNIYGDSDIDVVVLYADTFYKDMSRLTPEAQRIHEATYAPETYSWNNLRDDTLTALRAHFGAASVHLGNKSIKVQTGYGQRDSDVIPAVQFRRYTQFVDTSSMLAHWGICFFDNANNLIVNYPKYHITRGENKNSAQRTGGNYKPTIRVFKNVRNYLLDERLLSEGAAPSYFIECSLFNVPDNLFIGQFVTTVPSIIDYILNAPYASFLCQNGVTSLIGTGPTQWPADDFIASVIAFRTAWQNW